MLKIHIDKFEVYDESKAEFMYYPETDIVLEHSLVSISKWESKWHKPFLDSRTEKTNEEVIDYIRCMTLSQNVKDEIYEYLPAKVIDQVNAYIDDPMTATWFAKDNEHSQRNSEIITSELIYYWMITLNIPVKFEKWHLNRLITLIRVCNIKNTPPKKMSKKASMERMAALNKARREQANSKG